MGEVERQEGRRALALQSLAWVCDTCGETCSHASSSTVPQAPKSFPWPACFSVGPQGKGDGWKNGGNTKLG